MENRNTPNRPENEKGKKSVFKTLGIIGISLFLAILTVVLINI